MTYYEQFSEDSNSPESTKDKKELLSKFGESLKTGLFSDFTLKAYLDSHKQEGVKEIKVHKCILRNCKYFDGMFKSDCETSIRFIYTAEVKNLNKFVFDLMVSADMVSMIHSLYRLYEIPKDFGISID